MFRASFVAVLLAGVVLGGVGSSAEVEAHRVLVRVGGVCVREGARDRVAGKRVAGKRVVCVSNAKKQLRWRLVKAKTVRVVTGTTTSTTVVSTTTVAPTTTVASTTTTSSSSTTTSSSSTTFTTSTTLGGDRTAPVVILARSAGSSGVAKLTFTVTGNEPISCSTLSGSEGVDFRFTRISRINSITQTTEDVCTISAQSTAEPGDTNPRASTLTAAASFSIADTAGNAQTVLSGSPQTIWVQRIARPVIALSATTETANLNAVMNGYTVTSSGGTVASYSLTGTLPAGVSFSTTTGRITGTPTATQTATTYTITATNTSGSTTATFTLTVVRTCASGGECIVGNTGPGGGIVFYVHAGDPFTCGATLASTCKYLEAAPANWLTGTIGDPTRSWATNINVPSNQITLVLGADGTVIGMGYQNSLDIVAQTGNVAATSAAVEARAYQGNSKTDWHLPSKDELNELCKYARTQTTGDTAAQCDNTGTLRVGFSAAYYWSSSEIDGLSCCIAWPQHFSNGIQGFANDRKFDTNLVRPVRAFG